MFSDTYVCEMLASFVWLKASSSRVCGASSPPPSASFQRKAAAEQAGAPFQHWTASSYSLISSIRTPQTKPSQPHRIYTHTHTDLDVVFLAFCSMLSAAFSDSCCNLGTFGIDLVDLSPACVVGRKWFFVWCSVNIHVQAHVKHRGKESTACCDKHSQHGLMSRSELAENVRAHLFICNLLTCAKVQIAFLHQRKQL